MATVVTKHQKSAILKLLWGSRKANTNTLKECQTYKHINFVETFGMEWQRTKCAATSLFQKILFSFRDRLMQHPRKYDSEHPKQILMTNALVSFIGRQHLSCKDFSTILLKKEYKMQCSQSTDQVRSHLALGCIVLESCSL